MNRILVSSAFDDIRARDIRFLQEAAQLGAVHVHLWSDETVCARTGKAPKFPYAERLYFVQALRCVSRVHASLAGLGFTPDLHACLATDENPEMDAFCEKNGVSVRRIPDTQVRLFPAPGAQAPTGRKKVVVTGCYDWFHTGHIAFFEEVSALGDLHVCLGNDANIRLLKGEGHPLFAAPERLFIAGCIRYVTQALVSSGMGWMDAEHEILTVIQPDIYAVNEDGDKPQKAEFCRKHGIQYTVLKRVPKQGLARRSSSDLRGF
ncbi:MAG: adenylyltransferase/cytidyltransferase family protein [Verrucomicrobiota bacterium]